MKIKNWLAHAALAVIISVTSGAAMAQTVDCLEVPIGAIKEVSIQPSAAFVNCFYIEAPSDAQNVAFVAQSFNRSSFNLRELTLGADLQLSTVADNFSDAGATVVKTTPYRGRLYFSVLPRVTDNLPKNVAVAVGFSEGNLVAHIGIHDVIVASTQDPAPTSPPPVAGPTPLPGNPCWNPKVHCSQRVVLPLPSMMSTQAANCPASAAPPTDKNPKFDINANLRQFTDGRAAIAKLPPSLQDFTRAMIMTSLFYSNRKCDLKNSTNPEMKSGEKFGNWFFGAAAAEMGYTKSQALKAAAIVQQVQNYTYPEHPAYKDVTAMAAGIVYATKTGIGDNAGDGAAIEGGFEYAYAIYGSDPNSRNVSNSCDNAPPQRLSGNDVGGGTTVSAGSTWRSGSISPTPGCYGKCGGGNISLRVGPALKLQSHE